jgi:5'-3' exonuclease
MTRTVHLVDASVYVFRAYFATAAEFADHEGAPVHAVFGFLGFLLGMLEQAQPTHVGIAFDVSLTTSFRNRIYPAYKANRELPPPDLDKQFSYCRELTAALGLTAMAHDEFEADDLIGSALARARGEGYRGVIVTSDKDLSQLISAEDRIWDFAKRERYDADGVMARMGVRPDQVADFLALSGDAVDNIPGVVGIGPKTAAALLAHFDTLDALLARIEEVPFLRLRGAAGIAGKLREQQAMARLCRQLTGIALDAPVPAPDAFELAAPDLPRMDELLDRLKFGPLTRRRVREYAERVAV